MRGRKIHEAFAEIKKEETTIIHFAEFVAPPCQASILQLLCSITSQAN